MVQVIRGANSYVVVDTQHFPMIFTKFVGDVTVDMFGGYFEWVIRTNERAQSLGTRLVTVTDGIRGSRPSADARAFIAQQQDIIVDRFGDINIASYVALDSALVRGALTAIGWLSKHGLKITPVKSINEGVERGLADFDELGIPRPTTLTSATYAFPDVD